MNVTHEPLSGYAKELFEAGTPVRLYDWTNVAPGTPGAAAQYLEKIGLWQFWERHLDPDPMKCWTELGPREEPAPHCDMLQEARAPGY